MDVECIGMFFNESEISEDEDPQIALVIPKDTLNRSSGNIIGRFTYEINSKTKLVYRVYIDKVLVNEYRTNLPSTNSGKYDTVLFRYPGSARANKDGAHRIHVEYGLIPNIAEVSSKVVWDDVVAPGEADFVITLLPSKITE
jgi:hypothetical protein